MTNVITQWDEEDIIVRVELIAQIDQRPTPSPNPNEEVDWREVIIMFFQQGRLQKDLGQVRQIKRKVARFTLIDDNLYKRAFSRSLLKSLGSGEVEYVL